MKKKDNKQKKKTIKFSNENTKKKDKKRTFKKLLTNVYKEFKYKIPFEKYPISAELIAKEILDKLIINAFYFSNSKQLEIKENKLCYYYLENFLNTLLKIKYISDEIEYDKKLNFSNNINNIKKNTWIEIEEPKTNFIDRNQSNYLNINLNFNPEEQNLNNINNNNNNVIESEFEYSTTSFLDKNKSNIDSKEKKIKINKKNIKIKNIKLNEQKEKKIKILDNLPFFEIPNINKEFNHDNYEVENVNDLRKEVIENQIKKKIEIQNNKIEQEKKLKEKNEKEKKEKKFDSSKYSFDSNGKIITFKKLNIDSLQNEFYLLQNKIKSSKPIDLKSKNKLKKINNPSLKINNSNPNLHPINNNNNNNNNKIKKNSIIINNSEIIKNKIEEYIPNKLKYKSHIFEPVGSSFNLILPSIGVKITENKKVKTGGKDFEKIFNKFSNESYNKILNEYVPIQNKTLLHERINSLDNLMLSNFSNPLLSSRSNNNINNNNNVMFNTVANENKLNNNNNNSLYENNHNNYHSEKNIFSENNLNKDFKNDFALSRNFSNLMNSRFTNLKSEFDSIKDLNMNFEDNNEKKIENQNLFDEKNIFKRNLNKHKKNLKSLDLNFFNLKILRNNKWGNENNNKIKDFEENKYIKFFKPNRNNQLKDFNLSLKGKLPRERKIFNNYE